MSKIKELKRKSLVINKTIILTKNKNNKKNHFIGFLISIISIVAAIVTIYNITFESYNKRDANLQEVFWEYSNIIENIVYGKNIIANIEETKKIYPKITKLLEEKPFLVMVYFRKERFLNDSYSCILDSHKYSSLNEALSSFNKQMLLLYQINLAIKNDSNLLDKHDLLNKKMIIDRKEYCNQLSKLVSPIKMFSIIELPTNREIK